MIRIAIILLTLLLHGCGAKYPESAILNLEISPQPTGIYSNEVSVSIVGKDSRKNTEVIAYQITDGAAVGITNLSPPHILLSERVASGMRQQGLVRENPAPTTITLDIKELVATVTRPKMLYMTNATSKINLTIDNSGKKLSKKYNRQSNRESLNKPDVEELEGILNTQLSDIVTQILEDPAIRTFLQEQQET